ncbi:tetratricopeptide repeat protein [Actinomycetes bacterium KLBMP 9797]
MARRSPGDDPDRSILDVSGVRTLPDLAEVLRALRRRHARQRGDGELTYRELASRAGWSTAAVAEYLTGRTLPPTDRFDTLVRLLGAAPVEQGALATARDRVAEGQRRAPRRPSRSRRPAVPRQLPADVYAFTGREDELARLDALLDGGPAAMVISAVSGTAGVGKTALAVHWAHRVVDRFPDGQLYLNLRGYDPDQPVSPGDALTRLLGATGVAGADIPLDVEDRAARFRTHVAGRRMLIVLDNAATVAQVRPLLPGTPTCVVLVTSRDSLAGLVARDGARRIHLDRMPRPDATALLDHLLGARAAEEPDAVATLADLCARLPLALRVAAELAAARPATSLAALTAELAERHRRLDLLRAGGDPRAAVAEVFSWSVQHLPEPAARTFRLLGLHPGPDLEEHAVAALTGGDLAAARRDIEILARAHLIHPTGSGRYGMHDLLRAYATQLSDAHEAEDDRRAAQRRLCDLYLAGCHAATAALGLGGPRSLPIPAHVTPDLSRPDAARAWLDAERPCLVAAAAHGPPAFVIALSSTLYRYLDGGHYADGLSIHGHARRAAVRTGDRPGEAQALLGLGVAHLHLCQYAQAIGYLEQSLALAGDPAAEARALNVLGNVERLQGRHEPAIGYLHRALRLATLAGDASQQGFALTNLGTVVAQQGRYDTATDHLARAAALLGRAGNRLGEAIALTNLGLAAQRLGGFAAAAEHLQRALALFRLLGHREGEANTLDNLGSVHLSLGQPHDAIEHYTRALSLSREINNREVEAWALNGLGDAMRGVGRHSDALVHHTDALALATDVSAREPQARAHTGLGHAHRALGDLTQARYHFQQAVAGYTALGSGEADHIRTLLADLSVQTPS